MSLKQKNRAGQGGDCQRFSEDDYWRLVVLFGLGLLICVIHALGQLCERFPGQALTSPRIDDRLVWTIGHPDEDGLCQMDWLLATVGKTQASWPRLATIHFTEEQQVIITAMHPQAALLFFQPIPLNQADTEVLAALPGIGPALASRIVAKREELGGFQSLGQLRQVRGIGVKTMEGLQERLTL